VIKSVNVVYDGTYRLKDRPDDML